MSYNITNVHVLKLDATIPAKDVKRLFKDFKEDFPENCFLSYLEGEADDALMEGEPKKQLEIPNFYWSDDWSGHSYEDILIKKVAPLIHGEIEAVFVWEGGDDFSGLKIKDGFVIECDVEYKLIPKK